MTGQDQVLVATDVVGSTALVSALGLDASAALWTRHDRVARDAMRRFRGREVERTDGFLVAFDDARDALGWAAAYHEALAALSADGALRARVGVHLGPSSPRTRAVALRIQALAGPGRTLLSEPVADAAGGDAGALDAVGAWQLGDALEPLALRVVAGPDLGPFEPTESRDAWRARWDGSLWRPERAVPHNLPAERDRFVGREGELEACGRALREGGRLITLLGTGGVGKTRLARRLGWANLGALDAVWWVDLTETRRAEDIVPAVARALAVPLDDPDPTRKVGHALAAAGRVLVVLDNFEQVARYAADTVGRWLDATRDAVFVVTSREVLGLTGERVVALDVLGRKDAVTLFVERARAAHRPFVADADAMGAIEELVELLDRIPLAIELAAARVRVMSPATLVQRMTDRFRLLTSGGGRSARHETLRATIDWSWALLNPAERSALAQLSVFVGGFTVEDAEGVLDLSEAPDDPWVVDVVQALVDRSLVRAWGSAGADDRRMALYVSIHDYAAERLREGGPEAEATARERHAAWFAERYPPSVRAGLEDDRGPETMRRLHLDRENLERAIATWLDRDPTRLVDAVIALAFTLEAAEPARVVATALRMLAAGLPPDDDFRLRRTVYTAMYRTSTTANRLMLLDEALDRYGGARPDLACQLVVLRAQSLADGSREEARAEAARARALAAGAPDPVRASVLAVSALIEDDGLASLDEAIALLRRSGHLRQLGRALGNRAVLIKHRDRAAAVTSAREALTLHRRVGNASAEAIELGNLGSNLWIGGERDEGRALMEEALRLHRRSGNRRSEGVVLNNLGEGTYELGDADTARRLLQQAIEAHQAVGNVKSEAFAHRALGRIAFDAERWSEALEPLTRALHLYRTVTAAGYEHATTASLLAECHAREGRTTEARATLAAVPSTGLPESAVLDLRYRALLVDALAGEPGLAPRAAELRRAASAGPPASQWVVEMLDRLALPPDAST